MLCFHFVNTYSYYSDWFAAINRAWKEGHRMWAKIVGYCLYCWKEVKSDWRGWVVGQNAKERAAGREKRGSLPVCQG